MKRFLAVLVLVAGAQICAPVAAQHFDIWDFISHPRTVRYDETTPITATIAEANGRVYLPVAVREQVDDFFPMISAKVALLSHVPSPNPITQAALATAIPSGDSAQRELRYMAMFKREVQLGYSTLPPQIPGWVNQYNLPELWRNWIDFGVSEFLSACHLRAEKMADIMGVLNAKRMMSLGADIDFVRDSAQVALDEVQGFMLTSGRQNINLQTRPGKTARFYAPLTTLSMSSAERISVGTAGTATIHITGKSLPTLISLGGATPIVLEPNGNRSLTAAEVARGVKVWVQAVPTVTTHVANQTLGVAVVQSVSFAFAGENLTYAVASSQPSVCTVRLSETAGTAVLTGVRAGNATITITATNSSGSAVISFVATVGAD